MPLTQLLNFLCVFFWFSFLLTVHTNTHNYFRSITMPLDSRLFPNNNVFIICRQVSVDYVHRSYIVLVQERNGNSLLEEFVKKAFVEFHVNHYWQKYVCAKQPCQVIMRTIVALMLFIMFQILLKVSSNDFAIELRRQTEYCLYILFCASTSYYATV